MRLFAEDAEIFEAFAVRTRRPQKFNTHQQAAATDFFDVGRFDGSEALHQVFAQFGGAFGEFLLDDHVDGGASDGAPV